MALLERGQDHNPEQKPSISGESSRYEIINITPS